MTDKEAKEYAQRAYRVIENDVGLKLLVDKLKTTSIENPSNGPALRQCFMIISDIIGCNIDEFEDIVKTKL